MTSPRGQLDWLLNDFVKATPGVRHCVVVSGDGLPLAASGQVSTTLKDSLSAAASGLVSLARGVATLLESDPVTQTIVEMAGGYLFTTAVSTGSTLVVHTERECDLGMIGYEMTVLAGSVGHALTPAPRGSTGAAR